MNPDALIPTRDVADHLRVSLPQVNNYVTLGRLSPHIPGKRGRGGSAWYLKTDVERLGAELEEERLRELSESDGELSKELLQPLKEFHLNLGELTVMAAQSDPYRLSTRTGHEWGKWFRDIVERFVPHGTVHIRGLHYRLIGQKIFLRRS